MNTYQWQIDQAGIARGIFELHGDTLVLSEKTATAGIAPKYLAKMNRSIPKDSIHLTIIEPGVRCFIGDIRINDSFYFLPDIERGKDTVRINLKHPGKLTYIIVGCIDYVYPVMKIKDGDSSNEFVIVLPHNKHSLNEYVYDERFLIHGDTLTEITNYEGKAVFVKRH